MHRTSSSSAYRDQLPARRTFMYPPIELGELYCNNHTPVGEVPMGGVRGLRPHPLSPSPEGEGGRLRTGLPVGCAVRTFEVVPVRTAHPTSVTGSVRPSLSFRRGTEGEVAGHGRSPEKL